MNEKGSVEKKKRRDKLETSDNLNALEKSLVLCKLLPTAIFCLVYYEVSSMHMETRAVI